jgi:hypothetical protein
LKGVWYHNISYPVSNKKSISYIIPKLKESYAKVKIDYLDLNYGVIEKWEQIGVIEQRPDMDLLLHQIQLLLALYQHLLHSIYSIL